MLPRPVGAGCRRFPIPAHRPDQPGRLRVQTARQFPGSLVPACSSRTKSVSSAVRLSRSASKSVRAARWASLSASDFPRASISPINATWPDSARPSVPGTSLPPSSCKSATAMSADTETEGRVGTRHTRGSCLLFPFLMTVNGPVKHTCQGGRGVKDARIPRSCPIMHPFMETAPEIRQTGKCKGLPVNAQIRPGPALNSTAIAEANPPQKRPEDPSPRTTDLFRRPQSA